MHFDYSPDFIHKRAEPRYFVRSLDENDARYQDGYRYQIQFLNDDDQGEVCIEFCPDETDFASFPLEVPDAVVNAARKGINDYVDANGRCRDPLLGGAYKLMDGDDPDDFFLLRPLEDDDLNSSS